MNRHKFNFIVSECDRLMLKKHILVWSKINECLCCNYFKVRICGAGPGITLVTCNK
jgi:hypothetical protein